MLVSTMNWLAAQSKTQSQHDTFLDDYGIVRNYRKINLHIAVGFNVHSSSYLFLLFCSFPKLSIPLESVCSSSLLVCFWHSC